MENIILVFIIILGFVISSSAVSSVAYYSSLSPSIKQSKFYLVLTNGAGTLTILEIVLGVVYFFLVI